MTLPLPKARNALRFDSDVQIINAKGLLFKIRHLCSLLVQHYHGLACTMTIEHSVLY